MPLYSPSIFLRISPLSLWFIIQPSHFSSVLVLSVIPWLLEGVTWVCINPLINVTSSFLFIHAKMRGVVCLRAGWASGVLPHRKSELLESSKPETSKSGWQGAISISCYTTFPLGTETWFRLSWLWSLLQNNSPPFLQGAGYTCPRGSAGRKEHSFSCQKSQTSGLPHHRQVHKIPVLNKQWHYTPNYTLSNTGRLKKRKTISLFRKLLPRAPSFLACCLWFIQLQSNSNTCICVEETALTFHLEDLLGAKPTLGLYCCLGEPRLSLTLACYI